MKIDFTRVILTDLYGHSRPANMAQEFGNKIYSLASDKKVGDFGREVFESKGPVAVPAGAIPTIKTALFEGKYIVPVQDALEAAFNAIESGKETEYLQSLKVNPAQISEAEELLLANDYIKEDRLGDAFKKIKEAQEQPKEEQPVEEKPKEDAPVEESEQPKEDAPVEESEQPAEEVVESSDTER